MSAKNKKLKLNVKDYEKLGRTLESIFEGGYIDHKRVYRMNFVRGLFFGLGSVTGGTIILATLLWIMSFFTEIPLIGEFIENFRTTIEQ